MSNDSFEFSESALFFLGEKLPIETIKVFIAIWSKKDVGIRHKDIVEIIGDRYSVEKSLLLLDTMGFIITEKMINQKVKNYLPHPQRGYQLAVYINEHRHYKNNNQNQQ